MLCEHNNVRFQWHLSSAKSCFISYYKKTQLDTCYFFVFHYFTVIFSFPSLFTLLVSCTSIDIFILAPAESSHDSQIQSLQAPQGMSWGCFHSHSSTSLQLLFCRSHSTSFTPLRNNSFLDRESTIQQFFHKRRKRGGILKNHSYGAVLLSYSCSFETT